MLDANSLDLSGAPEYRKKATVLAFRQETGATYDKTDSWGTVQEIPDPHYLIVGTVQWQSRYVGGRIIDGDVYGCAEKEFHELYEPTENENEYRKVAPVRALQVKEPFTLDTTTRDGNVEVRGAKGEEGDWAVLQPGGERQVIKAATFDELYEPVPEAVGT
jgi:hypothetical protein